MGSPHSGSTKVFPYQLRQPASLLLDEQGMIRDCDNVCVDLFGYSLRELVSAHVSKLLPRLSGIELVQDGQFNTQVDDLCHRGHVFQVRARHGGAFPSELTFVSQDHSGTRMLKLFVLPSANTPVES